MEKARREGKEKTVLRLDQVAQRHAEYFRDLFERAETEQRTGPTAEWLALPADGHGRCKQVPFVNVERIDFELKRPTEDVTPEMRH
jgi:hypothetical protein